MLPSSPALVRPPHLDVRLDTSLEMLLDADYLGTTPVLATVVATLGSTYRKHGARMMIRDDGSYLGLLSGGCMEGDLILHAAEVRARGVAQAIEYDTRGPDDALFGLGAGCEGAMRILLEPAASGSHAARALAATRQALLSGQATALVVVHESPHRALGTYAMAEPLPAALKETARSVLETKASRTLDGSTAGVRERTLVEYIAPAPHLLVCGAGPDAQSVAALARLLGWRVSVLDHRPAYARPERFPGVDVKLAPARELARQVDLSSCHAAVVMSHHLESDTSYLQALAQRADPGYIGLLGPLARRSRILGDLGTAAAALEGRLHGPVGLDIGASTPEGIALAIIGQVHAWLARRDGR